MTFPMINNCKCAIFASCGGGKAEIVKVCFLLRYNVIDGRETTLSGRKILEFLLLLNFAPQGPFFIIIHLMIYYHQNLWKLSRGWLHFKSQVFLIYIYSITNYSKVCRIKNFWYVIHVPINVIQRPHNVFGSLKLLHYKYEFTLIMCDSCNCCNRL